MAWFLTAAIDLAAHFNLHEFRWPPFSFDDFKYHNVWWGLNEAHQIHYCESLAYVAMTAFVATAISYFGVARLSRELVGILCPASEAVDHSPNVSPKPREKTVA